MTLESAVKAEPRTMERKVNAGSPSSRKETMYLETSRPVIDLAGKSGSMLEWWIYHCE
jgi:hypothetical protein